MPSVEDQVWGPLSGELGILDKRWVLVGHLAGPLFSIGRVFSLRIKICAAATGTFTVGAGRKADLSTLSEDGFS